MKTTLNGLSIENNEVVAFKLPEHVTIPEGVTSIGDLSL